MPNGSGGNSTPARSSLMSQLMPFLASAGRIGTLCNADTSVITAERAAEFDLTAEDLVKGLPLEPQF